MYNNSYLNQYGGVYPTPGSQYLNSQYLQRPMATQPPPTSYGDIPFMYVGYGTLDEAKAYIVPPTKAALFINKNASEFYVKSSDNMGNPLLEAFKYSGMNENSTEDASLKFDPKNFVKTSDLDDVLKKDDLKGLLTADDAKTFSTKSEVEAINSKLAVLETEMRKLTRLSELLGGDKNGK